MADDLWRALKDTDRRGETPAAAAPGPAHLICLWRYALMERGPPRAGPGAQAPLPERRG